MKKTVPNLTICTPITLCVFWLQLYVIGIYGLFNIFEVLCIIFESSPKCLGTRKEINGNIYSESDLDFILLL